MRRNIIQKILFNNNNRTLCNTYKRGFIQVLLKPGITSKGIQNGFHNNKYIFSAQKNNAFFSTEKSQDLSSLSKEQIEEKILTVLKKYLPTDVEIKYDEELEKYKTKDNRAWDFLDTVEFLIDIESEFNITIPDETADNIKTVQEVIDYIIQLNIKKT
ncbi:mitochondrial ACP precursor, putative [Plasmodium sp. DRC-Itaito]|nr:mitochondrial ACP precursor, putative [Plasmodium sp. DRC-Itaito]